MSNVDENHSEPPPSIVSCDAKRKAFMNVVASIDTAVAFPKQVFKGAWDAFAFCESDNVFFPDFAEIVSCMLEIESADVCCMVNISLSTDMTIEDAATFYIDSRTTTDAYRLALMGRDEEWTLHFPRWGIASNVGQWAIYCERTNDVAVIAMRQNGNRHRFESILERLDAEPITTLLGGGTQKPYVFEMMVTPWREGLIRNYAMTGTERAIE